MIMGPCPVAVIVIFSARIMIGKYLEIKKGAPSSFIT
jgi:hypothetical protein